MPPSLTVARVTRSRSKKRSKAPVLKQVIVDLDPSEELEQTMDSQDQGEPGMQGMDTNKEVEIQ